MNAIRRERIKREIGLLQREIDRLAETAQLDDEMLGRLWRQKKALIEALEALTQGET